MKIVLATDTWEPDANSVSENLKKLYDQLVKLDHDVFLIHPGMFENVPCPGFPNIRLAKNPEYLRFVLKNLKYDALHIATEGPIGWAARDYCLDYGITYTSSYHNRLPEMLKAKYRIPLWLSFRILRKFHKFSAKVLVTDETLRDELLGNDFKRVDLLHWEPTTGDYIDVREFDWEGTALRFLKMQSFKHDVVDD